MVLHLGTHYSPTDHIPYCMATVTSKKKLYMKIKNPWHTQIPVPVLKILKIKKRKRHILYWKKLHSNVQCLIVYIFLKTFFPSKLLPYKILSDYLRTVVLPSPFRPTKPYRLPYAAHKKTRLN
jgi:hypothetical protein